MKPAQGAVNEVQLQAENKVDRNPPKVLTPREMTMFKNKVPFEENIYETLKFVIETISTRMRDKKPLSQDVLRQLEKSVEVILQDART